MLKEFSSTARTAKYEQTASSRPRTKARCRCWTYVPDKPMGLASKSIRSSGTRKTLGLLSGHASDLEDFEDVPDVVVNDQGATPESLVVAAAVDDDVEGIDAAVLLVDIDLHIISI